MAHGDDSGWYSAWTPDGHEYTPIQPTCECGVAKTLGKDDQPMFHSDYCPVKVRWQEDESFRERWILPKGKGS